MVKGAALITIIGKCSALGADVSNSRILIRPGKALPFEPHTHCRIRIQGQGVKAWWARSSAAGTSFWKETCRTVLSEALHQDRFTVLVLGDNDTGKSTFCTYLANSALIRGIVPCIVDGDAGQGDIAPPAAIGAALLRRPVLDLRDTDASLFDFVGSISPTGLEEHFADRLLALSQRSRDLASLQIINTDGYVHNGGLPYKRMIADRIQPDVIILLGDNHGLAGITASGPWDVLSVRSSDQARKSFVERRRRRNDQYLRFVGDGKIRVETTKVKFRYLGGSVSQDDIFSLLTHAPALTDVFVGLELNHVISGFGLLKNLDRNITEVRTSQNNFDTIHLSRIKVYNGVGEQFNLQMPGQPPPQT